MALRLVFAFYVIVSSLASCQAKPGNYSEAQCKLLPVEKRFTSEFRLNASEKGVRMVYLNLKISNDTYHPLESPRLFLPERWVWANSISEPMLSLPYDYDILSLGLLTYQVRSMDAPLTDHPSGCLARMNLSCQHKVVARALLNNTAQSSDKTDVVCVKMIADTEISDPLARLFDGNIIYQCCGKSKLVSAEESSIQCELQVRRSGWFQSFYHILNSVTLVLFFYWPALLLALPNSIFSLQEEYRKENQCQARRLRYGEDNASFENEMRDEGATKSGITGKNNEPNPLSGENATDQDRKTVRVCLDNNNRNVDSQIDKEESADENEVYFLDDTSPIKCSALFSKYTSEFPYSFSFSVKLAFLLYCVIPIVFYIDLGLNYITKRHIFDEFSSKRKAILGGQAILFTFPRIYFFILLAYPCPTIFLRPKHFRVNGKCLACKGRDLLLGKEMLEHLSKMQEIIYKFICLLIAVQKRVLEKLLRYCSGSGGQEDDTCTCTKKDAKKIAMTLVECLWNAIVVAVFGILMAIIFFGVFVGVSLVIGIFYSPFVCVIIALLRWKITKITKGKYCPCELTVAVHVFSYLFSLLVLISIIGASSCRVIVRMFAFIIMGLIFNAEIAGPFVTFLLAASTNTYLCYYTLQIRYQDVKQMISQKWQEHRHLLGDNTDVSNTDAIPARLFWHICGNETKSGYKILPVMNEIIRMFRNMALILIFLFLSWCSIIFLGNTYNISAVVATIAVFVSGVIPRLFFKGLTKEKRFSGATRRRMMDEIEEAVKDYIKMVQRVRMGRAV